MSADANPALGVTILILGSLLVLSQLGVNITPLIAGASVMGLAVSFGSQSLVRDIVSGLFSLADGYSGRLQNGTYSNELDANLSINCADTKGSIGEAEVRTLAADWNAKYPFFGAGAATGLFTCAAWPAG